MAGRIPQHFIDQLLSRVDIVDLIDSYVPLKKAGANYKACCPFHNEKTPSFTVSPSKQFYHCFGCGANGSAIGFLMEYDHMTFPEAVEKLASNAGLEVPTEARQPQVKAQGGIDLYQLMTQASNFYQAQLRQHADKQKAVEYLKKRGLSGEIAKRFDLGFAPIGWDNLIKELVKSPAIEKALVDTGMLTKNDKGRIYDRFRERIMFPIHDHRGRVVGFGGRILDQGEPKYLNSPETPIFHKGSELYGLYAARGAIKEAANVLVVEGYMDVVALAQAGINHSVATLGTATTPMHLQRLFRHTQAVTFCFDGDRAGKAAAWKALENCLPQLQDGFEVSFLFLPDGEDPDTMVRKVGKEAFLEMMSNATSLTDFLVNSLVSQTNLNRIDGRAKLAALAKPLIQKLPDGVLKKHTITKLSDAGVIQYDELNFKEKSDSKTKKPERSLPMTPIRRAISLLIQNPWLAQKTSNSVQLEKLETHGAELLIEINNHARSGEMTTATLLERYRAENHFSALEKLASYDHLLEDDQIESAYHAVLDNLLGQTAENHLQRLLDKSRQTPLTAEEKQQLNNLLSNSRK